VCGSGVVFRKTLVKWHRFKRGVSPPPVSLPGAPRRLVCEHVTFPSGKQLTWRAVPRVTPESIDANRFTGLSFNPNSAKDESVVPEVQIKNISYKFGHFSCGF